MQEKKTKSVAAVHGHITLERRYRYCTQCEKYSFPLDVTIGMDLGYTERLQRVAARCCGLWSYRLAADTLKELCGVNLSHTTIGTIAGHTADEMAARLLNNPDVRKDFQKAKGEVEFYADGVFVHIRNDDGKAKWLWNVSREVFGKSDECLDIYHGAQHISDCGKIVFGIGEESTAWFERMRLVLLSEGFSGMERELSLLPLALTEKQREAVDSLLDYLQNNAQRLHYARRLSEGRTIGSGLIEGACKNLVGRRLKQTGACWREKRANKIAFISSVLYSQQWKYCWKNSH